MNVKQEIEFLLEELKKAGIDRSKAEEDIGYSPNYITQSLSRKGGPSPRILVALRIYARDKFYNAQVQQPSLVNSDPDEYEARSKWEMKTEELINTIFEERDRALKKAEEEAKKWETLYQDKAKENLKLLDIISDLSKGKSGNVNTTAHIENAPAAKKNSQKKNKGH